jgi:hypothetical protein
MATEQFTVQYFGHTAECWVNDDQTLTIRSSIGTRTIPAGAHERSVEALAKLEFTRMIEQREDGDG